MRAVENQLQNDGEKSIESIIVFIFYNNFKKWKMDKKKRKDASLWTIRISSR